MPMRLAIIVSHPIQYYVPLYRRLAARSDLQVQVFYTWHGGSAAQLDRGFGKPVAWDIPLTEGYDFKVVPNTARRPGTHHFMGLRNPTLMDEVLSWQPNAVHLTGYPYASHLSALRALRGARIPVLFRGDSHLLEGASGLKWLLKRALLRTIYRWPAGFLYVGKANRSYYEKLGVPDSRLFACPHSVEVSRFAEPHDEYEQRAQRWRKELQIPDGASVLLFAGKFEPIKRPLELMDACMKVNDQNLVVVMVGDGPLRAEVLQRCNALPQRFRVLPFQNQSLMPVVYRLGHAVVLCSRSETWGLAVNEALACGRPVLVSDSVGCAPDVVQPGNNGHVFKSGDWEEFQRQLFPTFALASRHSAIQETARRFDIPETERTLVDALKIVVARGARAVS